MGHNLPPWKRISRHTLVDTKFMKVYEDSIELPDGQIIDDYTVVSMPSGVIVVATDAEGKLLTQLEYKYAIDKTILNLPSGSVEDGMSILDTAAKELLEETGYVSDELELIQTLHEYPSKADHFVHVVRAKNVRKSTNPVYELTENIGQVRLVAANEILDEVFDTTYNISALALTLPEFIKK